MSAPQVVILPAEYVGTANVVDGILDVGGVQVRYGDAPHGVAVYVRRFSDDLSVAEIVMAHHDGYAMEALDAEDEGVMT